MPFPKCHLYKPKRSQQLERLALRQDWHDSFINVSNDWYSGEWEDGKKHGYGKMITRSGRLYDGEWHREYRFRWGVSAFEVKKGVYQIEYRGNWCNGHQCGNGEKRYRDNSYYKGSFKNSKREGYGYMWYGDGSFYVGYFEKDLRVGEGMLVECNGNRFEGLWLDDQKHGPGRFYFVDTGQYMDGVWKENVCICSAVADIPFRQSAAHPTEFTINEVHLEDVSNLITDMIEYTLLYLDNERYEKAAWDMLTEKSSIYNSVMRLANR